MPLPPSGEPVDASAVAALVERHRSAAPVVQRLIGRLAERDPDGARTLAARLRRQRVLGLEQARQTVVLSRTLEAHGIAHLVVKGAGLAQSLHGDAAARASKDIDVLVDPARIAEAGEVIAACGFARTDVDTGEARKHRTYVAGAIQIELHNRLLDLPGFAPLDFASVWTRRGMVPLPGGTVPVLGDIDTLLYLCAHGSEHVWFRLKWLEDIACIVAGDPGGRVAAAARAAQAAGFDRVFGAMLVLLDAVYGIRPAGLELPRADRRTARAVALAWDAIVAPAELAYVPTARWIARRAWVQFGQRRDWRYRRALIADLATAPRSFDPAHGGAWNVFHLPVRAVRFWRSRR